MPQPNKIPRPFADSGDKNTIPESSGALGFASWQEGFPAITGTPFAQGGVAPKRADFNGIFNALSAVAVWQQQGGIFTYDNTTDYEVGNIVVYSGDIYVCITANGPNSTIKAPTDTTVWKKLILTNATTSAAGYMSPTDKTYFNALSPVESGTWTPVLAGETVAGVLTYAEQYGWYKKINNLVYIIGKLDISGYTTAPTGTAFIKGLPYASVDTSARYFGGAVGQNGLDGSFANIYGVTYLGNTSNLLISVNSRTNMGKTRYYANFSSTPSSSEFGIGLDQATQRIYFNCLYKTSV